VFAGKRKGEAPAGCSVLRAGVENNRAVFGKRKREKKKKKKKDYEKRDIFSQGKKNRGAHCSNNSNAARKQTPCTVPSTEKKRGKGGEVQTFFNSPRKKKDQTVLVMAECANLRMLVELI